MTYRKQAVWAPIVLVAALASPADAQQGPSGMWSFPLGIGGLRFHLLTNSFCQGIRAKSGYHLTDCWSCRMGSDCQQLRNPSSPATSARLGQAIGFCEDRQPPPDTIQPGVMSDTRSNTVLEADVVIKESIAGVIAQMTRSDGQKTASVCSVTGSGVGCANISPSLLGSAPASCNGLSVFNMSVAEHALAVQSASQGLPTTIDFLLCFNNQQPSQQALAVKPLASFSCANADALGVQGVLTTDNGYSWTKTAGEGAEDPTSCWPGGTCVTY